MFSFSSFCYKPPEKNIYQGKIQKYIHVGSATVKITNIILTKSKVTNNAAKKFAAQDVRNKMLRPKHAALHVQQEYAYKKCSNKLGELVVKQ